MYIESGESGELDYTEPLIRRLKEERMITSVGFVDDTRAGGRAAEGA